MKKASGTHRSMGKKGHTTAGVESGVSEVGKVGNTNPDQVSGSPRPKPQNHGSIANK
jgi:hypothetical protein